MTDATGAAVQSSVYSAFGMRVSGTNHRYGYDGAWGYQSHSFDEVPFGMDPDTAFPFLHVGHRYYDPSTGRFLQRDPIGIQGGINVYEYLSSSPVNALDPLGLAQSPMDAVDVTARGMECAPGAIRAYLEDAKRRHILKDHPDDPYRPCPRCQQIDNIVNPPAPPVPPLTAPDPDPTPPRRQTPPPEWWPGPPPYCFPVGTQVSTDSGLVAIEALDVGDCLKIGDDESGTTVSTELLHIQSRLVDSLFQVDLGDGVMIHVTSEHPFYVEGRAWTQANQLEAGMQLRTRDGQSVDILMVERIDLREPIQVFGLTVDIPNVYFVSEKEVLVHNKPHQ
jgi:RHS repeat-associated protein